MASNVWILGVSMMKFGRYPDKDTVDLGSQAAIDAMNDAGVTIHDMGVMGVGCLYEANAMLGQRIQKQIGQTGIPVYNVANACATGATALRTVITYDQGRRSRHGSCHRRRADGQDGSARWRWARDAATSTTTSARPLRRGHGDRWYPRHEPDARRVRTGRHGVRVQARRRRLRAVREGRREEPLALAAQPARAVPEGVLARGGHGRRDDLLPEHAPHVLPDRRRCSRGRRRLRGEAEDALEGAAEARREGLGVRADVRPVDARTVRCSRTSTR